MRMPTNPFAIKAKPAAEWRSPSTSQNIPTNKSLTLGESYESFLNAFVFNLNQLRPIWTTLLLSIWLIEKFAVIIDVEYDEAISSSAAFLEGQCSNVWRPEQHCSTTHNCQTRAHALNKLVTAPKHHFKSENK